MAPSIWTGSISFGLVNIPVKLYSAVRSHDISFHQYGPKGARIRNKRVSEKTGKEIDYGDIVKGYELPNGDVVMLTDEELDQFSPKSTKTIDIEDFVDIEDIDPMYYDHAYYVGPTETEGGAAKAYSLLLKALEKQQKVAIGKVVIRTKQYLAAIRPFNGALVLNTMRFADEVVPTEDIDLPDSSDGSDGKASASDKEVKMAAQIIDSLSTDWDPSRYHDTYTEQLMDYIERKAEGKDVVVPEQEEEPEKVVDLMAALQASLDAAKGKKPAAKKAPAKKAAAKKKAGAKKKAAPQRKSA